MNENNTIFTYFLGAFQLTRAMKRVKSERELNSTRDTEKTVRTKPKTVTADNAIHSSVNENNKRNVIQAHKRLSHNFQLKMRIKEKKHFFFDDN